jgi:large subunit ribosomal protein L4
MIAAALRSALSERYADGKLFVIENLASETPSTRQALQALSVVGDYKSAVVVLHRDEDSAWLSLRNVVNVHAIAVDQLNTYDVVANEVVVFTKDAMDDFIARTTSATESKPVIVPAAKKKAVKETKVKPAKVAKAPVEEVAPPAPVVEEVPAPVEEIVEAVVEAPVVEEPVLEEPVVEAPIEETPEVVEVVEEVAEVTKPAAKTAKAVKAEVAPEDKPDYGEGSYRGENPPEGFDIKGNEDSMLFHTPASRWYSRTVAEIWFNSEEAATAAGFTDVMENKK